MDVFGPFLSGKLKMKIQKTKYMKKCAFPLSLKHNRCNNTPDIDIIGELCKEIHQKPILGGSEQEK